METFEIVAKKNKKRLTKRIVLWSIAVVLGVAGVGIGTVTILEKIASKNILEVTEFYSSREGVAYPNIDVPASQIYPTANFSYSYQSHRTKDLDGVTVPYNDVTASAGLNFVRIDRGADGVSILGRPDGGKMTAYASGTNQKIPQFFNVKNQNSADWTAQPVQELPLLSEMPGQLVEVAITFDKAYSFEELKTMIPANLKQNWLWLGTESDYNVANLDIGNLFGFKLLKDDISYSFELFRNDLPKALNSQHGWTIISTSTGEIYQSKKDLETIQKKYQKVEDCRFSGVILTGKAENFAQLENQDWIYASSIGASTLNQPYYQLDKE